LRNGPRLSWASALTAGCHASLGVQSTVIIKWEGKGLQCAADVTGDWNLEDWKMMDWKMIDHMTK